MLERGDPLRGLLGVVLALVLVALVGWFLVIGKALLLPIFIAIISIYILTGASNALSLMPYASNLPERMRRLLVLAVSLLSFLFLGGVMISTAGQINDRLSEYQRNITTLLSTALTAFGIDNPDWQKIWTDATSGISLRKLSGRFLSSLSAAAGTLSLIIIYAVFLMGERGGFAHKIAVALPNDADNRAETIVRSINRAISDYLAVKTLVNVVLGGISFVVMWAFGIDFALFWAILIGLLNYIPYVGSLLGVMFPVALSMAQFGSVQTSLAIAVLLMAVQAWMGNSLEPRLIGRKVNMSPFVVLVALSLWTSLWGIPGAILAIPLTSIIAIIMGNFASTRPFAVLLSEDVNVFATEAEIKTDPAI
ncbi:AI-2E family transporter [Sulfitobacter sp. M57]|uniref:AI-2E family transporter n=1 Tax=unclassified Sulfitobacter TaxID=196795 RepID=UPI0023E2C434|nr:MULTISPECIES: AI-2E family transporter [unclassified Sulfitobacter]MDF3416640.1 AI-2E family transporter [Sulfitobacter sp. KE5]MDF3424120.1 AI-2E family transporter [Sulfitobacter sp. KE43]MDF3435185.1 AI-2E family transporter [Sulfitobacter sp. KE42]MDF3460811.1 AI-2E family transporter [Sulfitobacter sp. S74]MDF3464722.1 AI-2E family transporter [Sulfitobacter sp. Ks18]